MTIPLPAPRVGHFSSVPWIPNYVAADQWPAELLRCESSDVRRLTEAARLDITPMAVADWFDLGDSWHRLGHWGIAFREAAGSVCLFSPRPIAELDMAEIAICSQTTSSVRILQALLKDKYGLRIGPWRRDVDIDFDDTRTPRLLIQNEAIEERSRGRFPFVYDLGLEWREWQQTPVITAVWVYRAGTDPACVEAAQRWLARSMAQYRADPVAAIDAHRTRFGWSSRVDEILALHRNFDYELAGEAFDRGLDRMRDLLPRRVEGFDLAQRLAAEAE